MDRLVDPNSPKANVLIISTSTGPKDRTEFAHLYTQPRLLEYAKTHGYEIRLYSEPATIK